MLKLQRFISIFGITFLLLKHLLFEIHNTQKKGFPLLEKSNILAQ